MKIRDIMTGPVVSIQAEETVEVAARTMEHNNIGAIPVCNAAGRLCGMVTDRDIVTRCLAAGKSPKNTAVREIMTGKVYVARPDMEVSVVAGLMGKEQIRRIPVMENGRFCGMVTLGDIAGREESCRVAQNALTEISSGLSSRR